MSLVSNSIRNVPQPTPQADTKPDLTEDGVRDLDAARHHDAVVWDRMEALVRKLSATRYYSNEDQAEALAIVALLPEPVDPDLIEAREIAAGIHGEHREVGTAGNVRAGNFDNERSVQIALAAIKRGRALALAGEALEEAKTTLDVFLAAYDNFEDHLLVDRAHDDDLLTYGHLRTILRALAGEKEA